ncbi:MAG: hypothetical protein [Caudoviricetes sp.]|nr:MAG: hypothetical protein [Caudoviricetes sp.]
MNVTRIIKAVSDDLSINEIVERLSNVGIYINHIEVKSIHNKAGSEE